MVLIYRRSVNGELVKSAPNSPRKTTTADATSVSPSPSLSRIDVSHSPSPSPSPSRHYYSRERSMTNGSTAVPMSPVSYTPVERRRYRKRSPSHGGLTLKSRTSVGTTFSVYSAVSADLMQAYLRTVCIAHELRLAFELILLRGNFEIRVLNNISIEFYSFIFKMLEFLILFQSTVT